MTNPSGSIWRWSRGGRVTSVDTTEHFVCVHSSGGTFHLGSSTDNRAEQARVYPLVPSLALRGRSEAGNYFGKPQRQQHPKATLYCRKRRQRQSRSEAAVPLREHPQLGRWFLLPFAQLSPSCASSSLIFSHIKQCTIAIYSCLAQHTSSTMKASSPPPISDSSPFHG